MLLTIFYCDGIFGCYIVLFSWVVLHVSINIQSGLAK
jgi:hypothetical protein